jgi:hypothetical protein
MTTIITTSIVAIVITQYFSVRMTTGSGTTPSGSGWRSGFDVSSANGTSRQEQQEVEGQPSDEEQPNRDGGDKKRADRPVPQRLGRFPCSDRSGDVFRSVRGRRVAVVGH